jgi:hypothetical protein
MAALIAEPAFAIAALAVRKANEAAPAADPGSRPSCEPGARKAATRFIACLA